MPKIKLHYYKPTSFMKDIPFEIESKDILFVFTDALGIVSIETAGGFILLVDETVEQVNKTIQAAEFNESLTSIMHEEN